MAELCLASQMPPSWSRASHMRSCRLRMVTTGACSVLDPMKSQLPRKSQSPPTVSLFCCLCLALFVCLCVFLSAYQCLPVCLPVCLCVDLYVCLYVCLTVCGSV